MLEVVTGAWSIASAIRRLRRRLAGLPVRGVSITWHGGGAVRGDIVWLREEGFWWRHDNLRHPGRHSLMFGHAPQIPSLSESATCEINLPAKGADRRLAGALVRDDAGHLYLAHSGKIGGGRAGRHRQAFRAFLAGASWRAVRWPDGRQGELLLIAPIEGPRLVRQIGRFVQAVHRYKQQDGDGDALPLPAAWVAPQDAGLVDLEPPAAACDRGLLLDALGEALVRHGLAGNAPPLFAADGHDRRVIELVTETSAAALEHRLGRLLLRNAQAGAAAQPVLVVPDAAASTLAALSQHGVTLVRYRWRGARPVFVGLEAALG
ncbi:hypothetical protein FHP25_28950 [Vineibacter terrae]|uniref:Uncharacterized protein n=1 Tax=Vineibacter terrae TaxID=2586908 RepID=A0A5C8PDQ1_9HYPH|nr:hypothetical protein [Vineibacter terrae]TXL71720.1 hypothetical protein FHP25_28950 [Vineibacter terrae]